MTERKTRTPPQRTRSNRAATSAKTAKKVNGGQAVDGSTIEGAVSDVEEAISDALSDTVRLGYHVLAQNLEQGRVAAKQFRVGAYSVRNVPSDLNELTQRMMRLGRDLSLTAFDLLERVMQDPALLDVARRVVADIAASDSKTTPASPPGTQTGGAQAAGTAAAGARASNGGKIPVTGAAIMTAASPPAPFVPLTGTFSGDVDGALLTSWLMRSPSPTTLKISGLTTLAGEAPAITGITFRPSRDGFGVVADIPIPKGQPPGLYSGAVVSAETNLALGILTIQVGA
ncbi:MAG TPA: hypothetical protein VGF71_02040 [Caulobacteraceae bacterium]|jgi:hypothetical protein